jgi:poly(3-hydroxybutyrate) depolymerase
MSASATCISHVAKAFVLTFCVSLLAETGPRVETFFSSIDDTDQPYALYVPPDFDAAKRYPLVISLHGAGSNHRLNLRRVFGLGNQPGESDAEATRYFPKFPAIDMIVASPLSRGTMGYMGIPEADVYAVMDDVKNRFLIDEDRVYLTGLSMGGGGALYLALTRPGVWAAVAVVCPFMDPGFEPLAPNALNLPIKIFQGADDPVVRPEGVRAWRDRLKSSGAKVEYVEYPGVKHNSWDNAYARAAIFDWFRQHRRVRAPQRVQYTSISFEYLSAYWVQFDSFTPGVPATIDARIEKNEVVVETQNLDGFSLNLDPAAKRVVRIDGRRFTPKTLSFHKRADWQEGPAPSQTKRAGGILEALGSRHVYVYAEGERETAERLANWSTPRRPLLLTLRSLEAASATGKDLEGANVVLLPGVRPEGLFAATAPIRLNPGAADYTLITTASARDRQVVVIQGRPPASLAPRPFQPHLMRDYVLLRGEEVVAKGVYTKNWELLAADRQKLMDTGVIEVAP